MHTHRRSLKCWYRSCCHLMANLIKLGVLSLLSAFCLRISHQSDNDISIVPNANMIVGALHLLEAKKGQLLLEHKDAALDRIKIIRGPVRL